MPEYGKTTIVICDDDQDLGSRAAAAVAATMRERLSRQDELVMILAAGESQITFLAALAAQSDIAWDRTVCFNMDDFWDPRMPEQYTCGYQTRVQLYDKVQPKRTELVRYNAADPEAEALRFEQLLREAAPVDILCLVRTWADRFRFKSLGRGCAAGRAVKETVDRRSQL
jgi:glucosamine-6-phosphate deaminase